MRRINEIRRYENGVIFLNNPMIYKNGDQNIYILETPKELKERVDAYAHIHIRIQIQIQIYIQICVEKLDYDDNHQLIPQGPFLEHYEEINEKYESIYLADYPYE